MCWCCTSKGLTATLTYTDVHAAAPRSSSRACSSRSRVALEETQPRHGEQPGARRRLLPHASAASRRTTRRALERYLTFLGSRLVFLIDWNRARKRLREFLRKDDAVRLLKWAADQNLGHRGFLRARRRAAALRGDRVRPADAAALRRAAARGARARGRRRLPAVRAAARRRGLLQRRSERFIRDEIKAELARRFRSAQESLLAIALDPRRAGVRPGEQRARRACCATATARLGERLDAARAARQGGSRRRDATGEPHPLAGAPHPQTRGLRWRCCTRPTTPPTGSRKRPSS